MDDITNCKVVVINPSGLLHKLGFIWDGFLHLDLLRRYISCDYPNELKGLDVQNGRLDFVLRLCKRGNIVFFNDYIFAQFYFPDRLTDEQVNILNNLELGEVPTAIYYNVNDNNGIMPNNFFGNDYDALYSDVLNTYLENEREKGKNL